MGSDLDARIREGDVAAFTTFFRLHYAAVVHFLVRYVHARDVAEDIAQEAMIQVWERRATLDPARRAVGLLFTIARNRALNVRDRERTAARHAEQVLAQFVDPAQAPNAPAPDADLLAQELEQVVAARVATLPPRLREIYYMHREEGLSPATIADVLGITTPTVYVHLSRIVQALRAALDTWTGSR